jgi:hypothetical protein
MDYPHCFGLRGIWERIFRRLSAVSKGFVGKVGTSNPSSFFEKQRKRILAGVFFFLAIGLGWIAQDLAQTEAENRWGRNHPPSRAVVHYALASQGFVAVLEADSLQRVIRSIPTHLDDEGSFWITQDARWVVFILEGDTAIPASAYRLSSESRLKTEHWIPLGQGWGGFEELMKRVKSKAPRLLNSKTKKQLPLWKDPREIVY